MGMTVIIRDSVLLMTVFYYLFSSCVEYDLAASSVDGGVVFTNVITPSITLDTLYCPTCLQWYPYKEGDVEDK